MGSGSFDELTPIDSFHGLIPVIEDEEEGLGSSFRTPLISNQDSYLDSDSDDSSSSSSTILSTDDRKESGNEAVTKKAGPPTLLGIATALLAVGGLATSFAAIVAVQSIAVYVACGMCILTSPWMAAKQHRIAKEGPRTRHQGNRLREQVNLLTEQERILKATVDDLGEELDCLRDIEKELDGICAEQGLNRTETIALVNENESLLKNLKTCLREIALADITRIILQSDQDGNMNINLKEVRMLTLRIKLSLEQRGIDLDEKAFMALVKKDNDISHVLKVVGAIMFEDESIDDQDFGEYVEDALQSSERQSEMVGSMMLASSAFNRMRKLATGSSGEIEDNETPMFTLQERFTQGSVDVARGTRVTLSNHSPPGRTTQVMRQTARSIEASEILKPHAPGGLGAISENEDYVMQDEDCVIQEPTEKKRKGFKKKGKPMSRKASSLMEKEDKPKKKKKKLTALFRKNGF